MDLIKKITMTMLLTMLLALNVNASVKIGEFYYSLDLDNLTAEVATLEQFEYNANCPYIGEVIIPPSITYNGEKFIVNGIGEDAFRYFTIMQGDVKHLENTLLEKVSLPETIKYIKSRAFQGCTKLQSVNFPASLTRIDKYAFAYCESLQSAYLPASLTWIDYYAFLDCESLQSVYLPASLTCINVGAFSNCEGIESLWVAASAIIDHDSFLKAKKVFWLPNTEPLIKGTKVTYVSTSNISTDNELKRVEYLSSNFEGDNGIRYIPISPQQRTALAIDFNYSKNPDSLDIPATVTYKGIEMNVKGVGNYALSTIKSLEHLNVEAQLPEIPDGFVYNCDKLKEFTVDRYPTRIGACAFEGCKSLAHFTMLDWSTDVEVGRDAFKDCGLENIRIGRQLKYSPTEEDSPFANNATLKTAWVTDIPTEIGAYMFKGCTKLNNVSLGDRILSINDYAFSGCSSISRFSFGKAVKSIGREAFSDCTGMKDIYAEPIAPPTCGVQALDDINRWECTLHVQEQSKDAYANALQWKEFLFVEYGFGINLNVTTMYMNIGDTFQLKVMKNISSGNVTWKSTNKNILTVSDNGLVTAVGAGAASIAVINSDGLMDNCLITVADDSGVGDVYTDDTKTDIDMNSPYVVYNLNGIYVGTNTDNLTPGIYIIRQGSLSKKNVVR